MPATFDELNCLFIWFKFIAKQRGLRRKSKVTSVKRKTKTEVKIHRRVVTPRCQYRDKLLMQITTKYSSFVFPIYPSQLLKYPTCHPSKWNLILAGVSSYKKPYELDRMDFETFSTRNVLKKIFSNSWSMQDASFSKFPSDDRGRHEE